MTYFDEAQSILKTALYFVSSNPATYRNFVMEDIVFVAKNNLIIETEVFNNAKDLELSNKILEIINRLLKLKAFL